MYKLGDWSYWKTVKHPVTGENKKRFLKYTLKHRIRLLFGVGGSMPDGKYVYGHFKFIDKLPSKTQRLWYKFTFHIFSPLLNFIIR